MQKVNGGERYKCKFTNRECTINNVYPRGRGFQVCYKFDGLTYGLITGLGDFLKSFEKIAH